MFDDLAEMNCVLKYLIDEYPNRAATKYAIGLQSPDDYKGKRAMKDKSAEYWRYNNDNVIKVFMNGERVT